MTATDELLTDLLALGVVLATDGDRLRFHPRDKVTPELLARMRDCKGELLAMLRPAVSESPKPGADAQRAAQKPTGPICRCGSTTWRDVPIHGGQSVRRDCSRCERFLDFPVWHGKTTLQGAKQMIKPWHGQEVESTQ